MRRFGPDNYFKRTDELHPELFNPILSALDAAIDKLEQFRDVNWQEQVDLLNTNGLRRFNDAIKPVVDQIRAQASGGFLKATTADLVALVEGEDVSFYVPPEARTAFSPTPFLAILAPDVRDDWAIGRLTVYNEVTGLLTVEILHLNGSGAERAGWTVAASSGVVEAVSQWVDEITAMRDQVATDMATVAADKATVATDKATVLGYKNAAAQSVTDAADEVTEATYQAGVATAQAEIATTKAAEAAASAASIAGGPVSTVNGRSGPHVTGLAEADDVYSKIASDARYPLLSNTGTAAAKAADADGTLGANSDDRVPTQKAVRTLVDPLVPAIGDIRYSLRSSVAGWLPLDGSVYLKSAYPALLAAADFPPEWSAVSRLPNPASIPSGVPRCVAWSGDGRYVAVGHATTPFITIYDFQSGSPVKIANPVSGLAEVPQSCKFSPDGRYLGIATSSSPYVVLYDLETGLAVRETFAASPTGLGRSIAWSPDSRYMAVAHQVSPFITIYDLQTGSPVKLTNPATLPSSHCWGADWSPDGRYLVVGVTGVGLCIYDWQTGSPVKAADPSSQFTDNIDALAWSPDGRYLAVGLSSSPVPIIYDWESGEPIRLPALGLVLSGNGLTGIDWSPDGRFLAVTNNTNLATPYHAIIEVRGETFTRIGDVSPIPNGGGLGVAWSPNGEMLAIVMTNNPYIYFYEGYTYLSYDRATEFALPVIENGWIRVS